MVLGCGFIGGRRRAVFGVKFDAYRVRVFYAGRGYACRQNLRAKSLGKICCFGSNLAAHVFKFEIIQT